MAPLSTPAARLYLACALPLGLAYALLNPPFAVEAELSELGRVYEIAGGVFAPRNAAGAAPYVEVPAGYLRAAELTATALAHVELRLDRAQLWSELDRRQPEERVRTPAPVRASIPLPYLAYLPVLWLARDFSPLYQLYLARAAGVVVYMAVSTFAVALSGSLGWLFFALGAIPVALTQAAGVSADALTYALALLFFALFSHITRQEETARKRGPEWLSAGLICLLAYCNPAYLLLSFCLPALTPRAEPWRVRFRLMLITILTGTALLVLSSSLASEPAFASGRAFERAFRLVRHPWRALRMVGRTLFRRGDDYFLQLFSVHGLLTESARFAASVIATCYAQLLALLSLGALRAEPNAGQSRAARPWLLASAGAVAAALFFLAYCREQRPKVLVLTEMQGNWLTPLLPAACAALWHVRPLALRWLTRAGAYRVVLVVVVLNLYCLFALYGRFYASIQHDLPI